MRKSEWTKRPRTRPEPKRIIRIEGEDFYGKFSLLAEMRPRTSGEGSSLWVQHRKSTEFTFHPDYWPKSKRWKYLDESEAAKVRGNTPVPVLSEAVKT